MKYIKTGIFEIVVALLLAIFTAFSPLFRASADTMGETSGVMEDLQSAENFDAWDYPSIADDYSLQVIQIAESAQGRLFVYVYQPSHWVKDLRATSLNLTTNEDGTGYKRYALEMLDSSGVFDKYAVKDFATPTTQKRTYFIPSIFRAFDSSIDAAPTDDNTTTEKAFAVGQLWTATTGENGVEYAVQGLDVIEVDEKHVGFIRYMDFDGSFMGIYDNTDSHYLAFSTAHKIEDLQEAEIYFTHSARYVEQNSFWTNNNADSTGTPIEEYKTLKKSEIFEQSKWLAGDYKYNRIQTVDEFLKADGVNFTDETKAALQDKQWVLRFYESGYTRISEITGSDPLYNSRITTKWENVNDVTLLRLTYETDGEVYNVGVVDDVQSGDETPDGYGKDVLPWWVYVLICAAIVFAFFFIVLPLLKVLFKILFVPADIVDFFAGFGGK